jgi:hypothetical protein
MKTFFLLALVSSSAMAQDGATVIVLRGSAHTASGKELHLKDAVPPGTEITTEAKSYVKLLFADQTQMNIGPSSKLKLERTRPGEASLVNLVAGQLRAKVTKDPLNGLDGNPKDKMVIKTRSAAMGIRGTDFNVSFNPKNQITSLITFEGNVAIVQISGTQDAAAALRLENRLQHVTAGLYSGAQPGLTQASVPVKISPVQLAALAKNEAFKGLGEAPASRVAAAASTVPPGVDPKNFASAAASAPSASNGPAPEGFYDAKSGSFAPRSGGYVDLATARYIAPPVGSTFDPANGVYIPPGNLGHVDPATGMYSPPAGITLDAIKGFVPEAGSRLPSSTSNNARAMNIAIGLAQAGKTVAFQKDLAEMAAAAMTERKLASLPPLVNLPPPPKEPIDDPFCPTCQRDNVLFNPTQTQVRFKITVN